MSNPLIPDLQCGTIREAAISFKSKEIWRDNKTGGTIRESGTIRENTVVISKIPSAFKDHFFTSLLLLFIFF